MGRFRVLVDFRMLTLAVVLHMDPIAFAEAVYQMALVCDDLEQELHTELEKTVAVKPYKQVVVHWWEETATATAAVDQVARLGCVRQHSHEF